MIKINLLKNSGGEETQIRGAETVVGSLGEGTGSIGGIRRTKVTAGASVVPRILFLLLPVVLAYVYGTVESSNKQNEMKILSQTLGAKRKEVADLQPQVEAVKKIEESKKRIESQFQTIQVLSKERATNIRLLDALHSLIPQKVWLTELKIDSEKIQLIGRSVEDNDISKFMQSLEESVFFTDVTLESSQEEKNGEGTIKSFQLKAVREEQNSNGP